MKILVILAHPSPMSFNHAIGWAVRDVLEEYGHRVKFHDLYMEQFDPLLPAGEISKEAELPGRIMEYCKELSEAEGIVIIHPNWWGQPPAILKGWVDRIIRPGVAYKFLEKDSGEGIPKGLLKAKAAVVFNTSDTETRREYEIFGDPLETIWKNCIFNLCGVKNFYRRVYRIVVTSTEAERKEWIKDAQCLMTAVFPREG